MTYPRGRVAGVRFGRWFIGRYMYVMLVDGSEGEVYFAVMTRGEVEGPLQYMGWEILN